MSHVQLFATPGTTARQAPLSMGFSRQEWSGLPFPSPGDLPNSGIEPASLVSPALAGRFFTTEPPEKPRKSQPRSLRVIPDRPRHTNKPHPRIRPHTWVLYSQPKRKACLGLTRKENERKREKKKKWEGGGGGAVWVSLEVFHYLQKCPVQNRQEEEGRKMPTPRPGSCLFYSADTRIRVCWRPAGGRAAGSKPGARGRG